MKSEITGRIGHPHSSEKRKVVYFSETTLKIWNARKKALSGCIKGHLLTSYEFATFLLNQIGQGG